MKAYEKYLNGIKTIIEQIESTQSENIMKAATLLADVTEKGGIIYGFGAGHSHLVTEDAFWRAATPANYCALLEPSITGTFEITKSYLMENTYNIGRHVVDYHRVSPNDVMIIISMVVSFYFGTQHEKQEEIPPPSGGGIFPLISMVCSSSVLSGISRM